MQFFSTDYDSFLIISFITMSLSLVILFYSISRSFFEISNRAEFFGFLVFVSFGPSLDLYQFTNAYLSYGVGIISVSGVITIATGSRNPGFRLALCSLLAFIGLGSYQTVGQLLLIAAASLLVIPRLTNTSDEIRSKLLRAAAIIVTATIIGGGLYLTTNLMLKFAAVPGFENYPARQQGLHFVLKNIPKYADTLGTLLQWGPSLYAPLMPVVWRLAFTMIMIWTLFEILKNRVVGWPIAILGMAAAIALWPNPANMILSYYWPSARTLFGFAPFFGMLCAALFCLSERTSSEAKRWPIGILFLSTLVFGQCALATIRYQDRFVQQTADFSLAQSILVKAYETYRVDESIEIKLGVSCCAVGIAKQGVLDYRISLFGTSWSAPALLEYISGHRVSARMAGPNECNANLDRITYEKQSDGFLVCIRSS